MRHRPQHLSPQLAALAAVVGATVACAACGAHHPRRPTPMIVLPAARPSTATPTSIAVPGPVWRPDPKVTAIAERYVTAALSYTWTEPPQAWVTRVAPMCTSQWVAALRSDADGGAGGWPAIVARHATATAQVLAVYPSAGPGPGRRLEVTAHVHVASRNGTSTAGRAMFVDVLPQPGGQWLVGWAG